MQVYIYLIEVFCPHKKKNVVLDMGLSGELSGICRGGKESSVLKYENIGMGGVYPLIYIRHGVRTKHLACSLGINNKA